jgi:hypothetical protein
MLTAAEAVVSRCQRLDRSPENTEIGSPNHQRECPSTDGAIGEEGHMLAPEDFMTIQALVKRGVYLCDIAERTVRRPWPGGSAHPPGWPARECAGSYRPLVDQWLAEGVWNAVVIWRELLAKGYTGGISTLRDYLHPKRALPPGRATVRFETEPGRQLQSDWAISRTGIAGETTVVHLVVNTLSFSRRFPLLVHGDRGRRAHV